MCFIGFRPGAEAITWLGAAWWHGGMAGMAGGMAAWRHGGMVAWWYGGVTDIWECHIHVYTYGNDAGMGVVWRSTCIHTRG